MGPPLGTGLVAEGFPEPAALRMRFERQMSDHLDGASDLGGWRSGH